MHDNLSSLPTEPYRVLINVLADRLSVEAVLGEGHTKEDAATFLVVCIGNTVQRILTKKDFTRSVNELQVLVGVAKICGSPNRIHRLARMIYGHFGIAMPVKASVKAAQPNGEGQRTAEVKKDNNSGLREVVSTQTPDKLEVKYQIEREDYHSNIRQIMNGFLDILEGHKLDYLTSRQVEFLLSTRWFGIKRAIDNGWITPVKKSAYRPHFSQHRDDHGIYSIYEAALVSYVARRYRNLTEKKVKEIHEVLKEEIQKRINAEQAYWKGLSRESLRGMV